MNARLPFRSLLLCCVVVGELHAQRPDPVAGLAQRLESQGGRVIVGLRPAGGRGMKQPGARALSVSDATRIAESFRPLGFTPGHQFRVISAVSGTIAPGALSRLRAHPNVEYVQPDYPKSLVDAVRTTFTETTPYGIATIRAPEAWAATNPSRSGEGVKVGIMDTGGDSLHQDLRYAGGYDAITGSTAPSAWADTISVCEGHGTHVGGTVAAIRGNDLGVVGVAPAVDLYALKVFEDVDGWCLAYTSTILAAFDWAIQHGIQVINMSFGQSTYDQAEHVAIQAAVANGIVLVAAAGNSNGPVGYPAANPEVIAVAATDELDARAPFSSYGPQVDVAAPGVDVLSTLPNNQYASYSGTSMASPHVTGLAALLRSVNPALTVDQVRTFITAFAVDLGSPGEDDLFGFGRVDALASVTAVLGPTLPTLSIMRQPDSGVWGEPLAVQPIVQLVDTNGAPIAQAGVRVSANVARGTGRVIGGSAPAGPARKSGPKSPAVTSEVQAISVLTDQNGVAEFTNLIIEGTGPHVLEFSTPGYMAVSSQEFPVTFPPPTQLSNGVSVTGIAGELGSMQFWVLTVPPEAANVTFTTSDGSGDVDLYVRRGEIPDLSFFDCRSWSYTTYETCSFDGNVAGDWYVMLHAYDTFSGVTLRGTWRVQLTPAMLLFTQQPVGAPVGEPLRQQPAVQLYDQQGQQLPLSGVTVSVSAATGGVLGDRLPPFLTAVTDSFGRATFDGLYLTQQGTHTLIFTVPGLPALGSQDIIISAPLPPAASIGQVLIGAQALPPEQQSYLDAVGNADGVFNLGDFVAYLERAGLTGSPPAIPTARATPARRPRSPRRVP
jgi:subtilisin family serine protease